MRRIHLKFSAEAVVHVLTERREFDRLAVVTAGLPEGARLCGATFDGSLLILAFEHESFPETPEGGELPVRRIGYSLFTDVGARPVV